MRDKVHTNEQRINKIRSVFVAVHELKRTLEALKGADHPLVLTLEGIKQETIEAEGSLEAIEKFLADRNALKGIE
jgi:hypothetical protein